MLVLIFLIYLFGELVSGLKEGPVCFFGMFIEEERVLIVPFVEHCKINIFITQLMKRRTPSINNSLLLDHDKQNQVFQITQLQNLVNSLQNKLQKVYNSHQYHDIQLKISHILHSNQINIQQNQSLAQNNLFLQQSIATLEEQLQSQHHHNLNLQQTLRNQINSMNIKQQALKRQISHLQNLHNKDQKMHQEQMKDMKVQFGREIQQLKNDFLTIKKNHLSHINELENIIRSKQGQFNSIFLKKQQEAAELSDCLNIQIEIKSKMEKQILSLRSDITQITSDLRKNQQDFELALQKHQQQNHSLAHQIMVLSEQKQNIIKQLKKVISNKAQQIEAISNTSDRQMLRLQDLISTKIQQNSQMQCDIEGLLKQLKQKNHQIRVIESKLQKQIIEQMSDSERMCQMMKKCEQQKEDGKIIIKQHQKRIIQLQEDKNIKRNQIQKLLYALENTKIKGVESLDSKNKQIQLLREEGKYLQQELVKVKLDNQNLKKTILKTNQRIQWLQQELRDKQNKLDLKQNHLVTLERLVQRQQVRIIQLNKQLEMHQQGIAKEMMGLQIENYVEKFNSEYKALQRAHDEQRKRMQKLLDFQISDQARMQQKKVQIYQQQIRELEQKLGRCMKQIYQERAKRL